MVPNKELHAGYQTAFTQHQWQKHKNQSLASSKGCCSCPLVWWNESPWVWWTVEFRHGGVRKAEWSLLQNYPQTKAKENAKAYTRRRQWREKERKQEMIKIRLKKEGTDYYWGWRKVGRDDSGRSWITAGNKGKKARESWMVRWGRWRNRVCEKVQEAVEWRRW